jgi:hypothetical protein
VGEAEPVGVGMRQDVVDLDDVGEDRRHDDFSLVTGSIVPRLSPLRAAISRSLTRFSSLSSIVVRIPRT